jgi:hypothetical protein
MTDAAHIIPGSPKQLDDVRCISTLGKTQFWKKSSNIAPTFLYVESNLQNFSK